MNPRFLPCASAFATLLLIAGCATEPQKVSPTKAPAPTPTPAPKVVAAPKPAAPAPVAAAKPVEAPKPAVQAPAADIPPPRLSPEARAVIERLTQGGSDTLQHELSGSTGFPEAMSSLQPGARAPALEFSEEANQPPARGLTADGNSTQLVERDWTGLVLVPVATSLAKAYSSDVRLLKVEAHPLTDGRVRIWTRVHNVSNGTLPAEIAFEFRMKGMGRPPSPYFYQLEVPGNTYRDVFFVSPEGDLVSYTVLVRSADMVTR